ncbi:hypothetical protein BpHYR1_045769 [Brachionus plicatilis]|uniref:Uncharacterized protein n=1 Tax=Brachionus plicatilis TaxID=10195 RepID=A0A3M7RDG0_BRAPC|nr:hypothetical protein BpHYR1_045769 [Brachionus plicatilis]
MFEANFISSTNIAPYPLNLKILLKWTAFKISFVITTLCNFKNCISYQGLQNSANLAKIRF